MPAGKPLAIKALLVVIGASGILGQLLLLRELMIIYRGNELIIGMVLGNWLIFEAAGAFWGRKITTSTATVMYPLGFVLYSLIVPFSIFIARGVNYRLFSMVPGEIASMEVIFLVSILVLAFAGFVHGLLFPLTCRLLEKEERGNLNITGRVYIYETLGTLIGGTLFTFCLANSYDPFQISVTLLALHLFFCIVLFKYFPRLKIHPVLNIFAATCILLAWIMFITPVSYWLQEISLHNQWPGRNILHYENTAYGNILITESGGEFTFSQDGQPLLTYPNPDQLAIEDLAHLALAAHPAPALVLIVGAGVGGFLEEVLKHPVDRIDYLEINPRLPELYTANLPEHASEELHDPRVRVINTDIRHYLAYTEEQYDYVLVINFQPDTLQVNRLFTEEFFKLVKRAIKDEGVLFYSAPGAPLKYTDDILPLSSSLLKTMRTVFPYVAILPGDNTYFFASNEAINLSDYAITERLVERELSDGLINANYLKYRLDPQRLQVNLELINQKPAAVNRDYQPVAFYYALLASGYYYSPFLYTVMSWLQSAPLLWFAVLLPLLAVTIWFLIINKKLSNACHYTIFSTGMAGMAFNLVILYAFQSLYGIIYQALGLFFVTFMGGLLLGGMLGVHYSKIDKRPAFLLYSELLVLILHPLLFSTAILMQIIYGNVDSLFIAAVFLLFALICGATVGFQFPLAAGTAESANDRQSAGSLYASDLLGGWVGGMIISIIFYPLTGLAGTLLITGLIKLSSLLGLLPASGGQH